MWVIVLLLLLILPFAIFSWKLWSISYKYRNLQNIPGPHISPLFGNIFQIGSNIVESYENLNSFAQKYGGFFRLWFRPFQMCLVVSKAEYLENFISSSVLIDKSEGYDNFKCWLGNGLIAGNEEIWRKHRKLLTPAFHFQILEKCVDHFENHIKILLEKLRENANCVYNVYPILTHYTMDVICQSAMNYTSLYTVYKKALDTMISFTKSVIKQRRTTRKMCKTVEESREIDELKIRKRVAFLDLMLDISDQGGELTDEEIREEVDTIMLAGHDTIASVIAFSLFELAKHEDVQEKIYEESIQIMGNDEGLSFRQLNRLDYLERVIKECMRLNTIVPFFERKLRHATEINGLLAPAGTNVMDLLKAMDMDPEYFPEPEKFDPDRFLTENCEKRHRYAYIPFSAGPRNCIGESDAGQHYSCISNTSGKTCVPNDIGK